MFRLFAVGLLASHFLIVETFQSRKHSPTLSPKKVTLFTEDFGKHQGKTVKLFTWRSLTGISVSVISYGAIIQSIKVPDSRGMVSDVVLGFDDLQSYVSRNTGYFGAIVGRYANRIAKATFEIDGVRYFLAKNEGQNHIHGGLVGFDKVVWEPTVVDNKVIFSYLSRDGEEQYPGDLITNVAYELLPDGSFHLDITATTTKKTVVSLVNHSYFNLAGHERGAKGLYEHLVTINADRITETDSSSIPTGKFLKVGGSPFDLRTPRKLGQLLRDNLYDDNFCISNFRSENLNFVSRVIHPQSGRFLEVYSDQPGVQFYTANSLPAANETALIGKNSVGYRRHGAFCLETQKFPDGVNHANFPSTVLTPGEVYKHSTVYKFGVETRDAPMVLQWHHSLQE